MIIIRLHCMSHCLPFAAPHWMPHDHHDAPAGASNQAKIDVAEARKRGDVGEKRFSAETRQSIADLEATTQIVENEKAAARAESAATLRVRQAGFEQSAKLAEISSRQAALMREAELEVTLQQRNAQVEQEVLRTKMLASAIVEAEATIKRAEGEAEAARRTADAELYRKQKEAEALLALQQKEAEGTRAKYHALSEGLASVRTSMGGSPVSHSQPPSLDDGIVIPLTSS